MSKGHGNIAAIGTEALNKEWGTSFKTFLKLGDSHDEISVLKENLRKYRSNADWTSVLYLEGNYIHVI
ncbi:hypothetical protein ACWGXJ_25385 [Paenibacillus sp. S33]